MSDHLLITEPLEYTCECGATFSAPAKPESGRLFRCPACREVRQAHRRASRKGDEEPKKAGVEAGYRAHNGGRALFREPIPVSDSDDSRGGSGPVRWIVRNGVNVEGENT